MRKHRPWNVAFAAILISIGSAGYADTISGNYVGCFTERSLDEFITAAGNEDTRQMNALLETACANINGREYSVVDRGFTKSQVRVYVGQDSVVLWTISAAIR